MWPHAIASAKAGREETDTLAGRGWQGLAGLAERQAVPSGTVCSPPKRWWGEQDSNLRRRSHQIYSLVHLAALESPRLESGLSQS